ncbi:MAG: bilirubin oxidase [Hydrocarboniphaga sp.]|uniref:multicopper oxidase family protein n=1 Tax=Hydrocarboniphaga sp. TaxID=2033016 RepID=UPI0026216270|nr:multicopper oxidase domain-containing protein [Hydrocarboniphaga sp.]MDB5971273.1 bilirubin oxidase [Hydrocarboniphaga sp.]
MSFNRRRFLRDTAAIAAGLMASPLNATDALILPMCRGPRLIKTGLNAAAGPQRVALNPNRLARFVDALPIPKVATSSDLRASPDDARLKLPYYRVEMREVTSQLHRDLAPTRQWSYGGSVPGPTFETRSHQGLLIEWVNALPAKHFLTIDFGLHGAEAANPEVRTVAHVHGAKTPPGSDGYPELWYAPGQSATYHYPNRQDAATLWYHDHAMGITRLNIFAGLLGLFIVRDEAEDALDLPRGEYEIPLVLYDRTLDRDAQLFYPDSGDPNAPWIPEVYGNVSLCNGKMFPFLDVEPRAYRLRVVNAANGRFYNLALSNHQAFRQIGCDLGLLPQPVELATVTLFPGERADLVIDFSGHAGEKIVLKNQNDELLQFRVTQSTAKASVALPASLRAVPQMDESQAVKTRVLTLGERDDYQGNSTTVLLDGKRWDAPISEKPVLDSTEIWSFVNITGDTHPVHLHLVRFQILDRRPFDLFAWNAKKSLEYTGPAQKPAPGESGWKDTVRCDPGEVTRIIVRFEGYAGRYVWHCHLLEHEDNEMMRPYEIVAAGSRAV